MPCVMQVQGAVEILHYPQPVHHAVQSRPRPSVPPHPQDPTPANAARPAPGRSAYRPGARRGDRLAHAGLVASSPSQRIRPPLAIVRPPPAIVRPTVAPVWTRPCPLATPTERSTVYGQRHRQRIVDLRCSVRSFLCRVPSPSKVRHPRGREHIAFEPHFCVEYTSSEGRPSLATVHSLDLGC